MIPGIEEFAGDLTFRIVFARDCDGFSRVVVVKPDEWATASCREGLAT